MAACIANDGREAVTLGFCSAHYARYRKHGDPLLHVPLKNPRSDLGRRHGPKDPAFLDPEKRPCRACGQVKSLDDFGPLPKGPLGRKYTCRPCDALKAKRDRDRWNSDPDRREQLLEIRSRSRVKGTYGEAGLAARERILRGDPCDVCGRSFPGKRRRTMAIDHCHATGRIRGILCKDCNLVLGWMNDNPKWLRGLADYLERGA